MCLDVLRGDLMEGEEEKEEEEEEEDCGCDYYFGSIHLCLSSIELQSSASLASLA